MPRLRVQRLSQVFPLPMDSVLQTVLEKLRPRDCNFPARRHWNRRWARDSSLLSHLLGALWHCQSRAGTGATMPHAKIPWAHTHDPDLPRSPQVLVVLVLSGAKGRMGGAEVPENAGAGTENLPQGGRTTCELTQAPLSL